VTTGRAPPGSGPAQQQRVALAQRQLQRLGQAQFVAPGEYVFTAAAETTRPLRNVVVLNWAMVSAADGTPAGRGINVRDLDDDGRIRIDHLFVER